MTSSKSVIDVIRISITSNPIVFLTVGYIYVYGSNPQRLLGIALFMNRVWRHQFGPEITIEKDCWNVVAVLPCEETIEICCFIFWINIAFNYDMCGRYQIILRVYGIRKIIAVYICLLPK